MKKHLLFNQLFGTEGSPNQTGETLTRENRIGLMSYLRRTLMLLFAVLMLSIANIGMAWGAEYALLNHDPLDFTGEFICNPTTPTTSVQTFGGKTFAGYVMTAGNLSSWANGKAEYKTIDYDIKTTSTTFTIYVGNPIKSTPQLYYVVYDESSTAHTGPDVVQTAIGDALPYDASNTSYSTRSVTIERSKNARVCFYTSASTKTYIYQIIAEENGDPLPKVGEGGYALNMVSGRFCATNTTNIAKVDHNLTIDMYNSYNMGAGSNVTLYPGSSGTAGDHYLSFTTPANPGKLKVTFSGKGTLVYSTKKDGTSTTTMTTGSEYTLSGNTLYYLYNTVPTQKIQITKLEFIPIAPTFSVSADAELTAETDAVTLTSAGNTIYYKWSTNSSAYAANAGSTLAGAADGSGTSPVDATAPAGTGTYYLYAVAKNGTYYSDVVKRSYTIVAPAPATTCADAYSFHYGPNGGSWETPICFTQVGETHEWNIENFTIPSHANGEFWVGYAGSTNGQSVTKRWTDGLSDTGSGIMNGAMVLLPTNGSIVGQASGATGTLSIWDDSESKNQYVGFKPDGYAIMYGGNNYAFSETATSNVWETDLLTLPDVSTTYQVGIKTSSSYTTCSHSKSAEALSTPGNTTLKDGKKYIYLNAGVWRTNAEGRPDDVNEKMAVWDATNVSGEWGNGGNFLTYNKATGLYEGYVSSSTTKIVLARINNGRASLGNTWGDGVYNQTYDITLTATNNEFTITAWHDNNDDKKPSTHTAAPHSHPATGDNGKFRMYDNSNDANWYVHWIPYYKLSYDGNGGTGSVAAQYRNSELSTSPLSVAGNGFTREGWRFAGWNTNKYGTGTDYAPGDNIDITGDQTLYAKWERDIYLQSDVSWWYNDNAWFAVYCFDSEHDTNYKWVSMTRAEECSSPAVYKVALPGNNFDKVIFVRMNKNKASLEWASKDNQTTDITYPDLAEDEDLFTISNGDDGNACTGTWGTYSVPTFTISYNAGTGGSGSRGNDSKSCNVAFTLPGVVFTRTGYTQTGWTTSDGGSQTHALGGSYTTNDDQTFYPVWSQIMVSSVALNKANTTITEGGTETLTATVLPATALDKTVTWTTSDGDVATVDDGVVTAVGVGSATITATAHDGSGVYAECAITVEEAASCSGDPTALESGELYTIDEMVSNCSATAISSTTSGDPGIYQYGLSSNGKFYIVGTTNGDNASTGTVEMKKLNNDGSSTTVGDASITYVAWLKGEGSTSCRSIKFVIPTRGVLTVYGKGGGTSSGKGNVQILENSTGTVTEVIAKSSNSACKSSEIAVNAGTYYIYSSGASAAIYGLRFEEITVPNVSGLGVDDGATLSSIPLSWTIPGICDLSDPKAPSHNAIGTIDNIEYLSTATRDSVTVEGDAPKWEQYGVGFDIPATTGIEWFSFDFYGNGLSSDVVLWGGLNDASDSYWEKDKTIKPLADKTWYNSGNLIPSDRFWHAAGISTPMPQSITQVAIYLNSENYDNNNQSFSVRNVRYGISGQNDIDHIVLMRKEGSAATGIADASATKLYEGTRSHYTDASDVTGKNYYYTVFAVHASGAVSTGVSTSLTLYTITYNAGANGTGTVPAGKKTHGINFTLSSSKFTRDGYTQDGWSTSDGGDKIYELGATYSTNAALTLYPHWVAVSGPVITNGSPANGSIAVTSDGSTPILSAVTGSTVYIAATPSTGYNFTSWDVYKTDESGTKVSLAGSTASTSFIMPSYAVTVNASFAAKTYTVTLNGNGGSGNTANVTVTYNSSTLSSSITNPTLTGYIFDGWYSGSGGTGSLVIDDSGVLQADVAGYTGAGGIWTKDATTTLYAKWSRDEKKAKWGTGYNAFPDNNSDTRENVTITTTKKSHTGSAFGSRQYYNFGNGEYIDINLASGYYLTDIKTCSYNDPYRVVDAVEMYDVDTKLYINFSSSSTYSTSTVLNAEPILLTANTYNNWDIETYKNTVASIPSGAQSARIFAEGSFDFGGDLFYLEVERTAYECTPSVSFNDGGATSGTAPISRTVCGEFTLPGSGSLAKKGNTFTGWSDGTSTYEEGDTYDVTEDVTFTAQWSPFVVPVVTGLEIDDDYALTWSIPGKLDLSTASLSNSDPDYFIVYQEPAGSKSYNSSTEELTVTYTVNAEHQPGVAIPFTLANLESITYDYKGLRVFPAVVKSDGSTLYWDYDNIPTSDSWTRVTQTPTTIYPNEGIQNPLPAAKAITFSANPLENKTNESFYIRNAFYHTTGMVDIDHVVLMRKEGSAATDTTEAGTAVLLYSGKKSHYTDESVVKGKTYYYTVFSVHADGTLSVGTTQSVTVPKDDLDITYAAGTASSVTHNSATLPFTMSATTGVASVTLKVYKNGDNSLVNTIEGVTAATSGSGNVTGLDAETSYYFTVTPIGDATHNDGTESGKSATFTTSAAPTLSALVAGTLYEVPDMIPSGASLTSDDQFFEGLSANTKFTLIGSASSSTTPKVNNKPSNDRTIAGITFDDGSMWFKGNATVSENIPSTFGLSFIVPSAGKLYLYFDNDDTSTNIKLAKSGTSGSKPTVSSGYSVVDVTSGTYYMYGTSESSPYSFYGMKFVPTYDITLHDNNGGDNNGSADVAVNGTTLLDIDAPTRSGYAVTGYYAEAECTTLVADAEGNMEANVTVSAVDWTDKDGKWVKGSGATLYAKWGRVYTVTFNTNGGSSVDAITQTSEGASITMPAAPTKSGYTFNGWQIGSTYAAGASYTPTANVTAYATWKAECGVIKWDFTNYTDKDISLTEGRTTSYTANDGETEMRYTAGNTEKIFAPSVGTLGYLKENGKTSSGSYTDLDGTTPIGKTRLIRLFVEAGSGTLRINCNGTNGEYKVLDGSASGTTLISSLSANTTSSSITLTTSPLWIETTTKGYINDIRWTPSSTVCYYVTYNGNGADGGYVNDPEAHSSGDNVTTLANSFTRTGCTFTGWNTAADGSGTAYAADGTISSISGNVTLYAQWKITVSENKNLSEYTSDALSTTDVVVTNGATLTVTEDTEVRNITVETGSTLNVNTTNGDGTGDGVTFTANSLSLKGGLNSSGTKYDMPRVYIDPASSIVRTNSTINFDISVDATHYYPIAVPFPVTVSDVDYVNSTLAGASTYGTHYVIKEYDGAGRAENGAVDANWKVVNDGTVYGASSATLQPGTGYILTAVSIPSYGGGVIRFPMKSISDDWLDKGEQATVSAVTKNEVTVTAHTGKATEGGKNSNKGWNMLGVPYMSCFASKSNYAHDAEGGFIKGKLNFITGEYTETSNVYVTVPTSDFSEYLQFNFDDADTKLLPGWCFFVQVDKDGTIMFEDDGQTNSSSLPIYAPKREQEMPTVKTGIILSSETANDKTTILVSDKYDGTEYEINADLEKMFGNGYTLATYSLAGTTRLAYNAMSNSDATNVIPIGYRAPADGEYTFAINPRYAENGAFEHVNLIDYETGFVTDLLQSTYTFDTERTQNDTRFALNIVKAPQTTTDITVTGDGLQVTGPQKVIINDKLYIIVDGKMYDAKGVMVK